MIAWGWLASKCTEFFGGFVVGYQYNKVKLKDAQTDFCPEQTKQLISATLKTHCGKFLVNFDGNVEDNRLNAHF